MMKKKDRTEKKTLASDEIHIDLADYSALTLDTSVVKETGYNFNKGLLATLENQLIPVIISEVIDKEIMKHLYEQRDEAVIQLKSANCELYKKNIITKDEFNEMQSKADEIENKDPCALFEKFKSVNNITEIKADLCAMKDLITIYFNSQPPFNKKDKKYEFPDAIALLSLEEWAKTNDKKILAFSKDKDWMAYSKNSKHIVVVQKLGSVLGKIKTFEDEKDKMTNDETSLTPISDKQEKIYEIIFNINNNDKNNIKFKRNINKLLFENVPKANIKVSCDKGYGVGPSGNWESPKAQYLSNSFIIPDDIKKIDLLVLPSSKDKTNFIITIYIDLTVHELFRQLVSRGTVLDTRGDFLKKTSEVKYPIRAVFTLLGDVLEDNYKPRISNISIDGSMNISFGFVELDE